MTDDEANNARIAALVAELAESDDRARRLAEWLDAERERREAAEEMLRDASKYTEDYSLARDVAAYFARHKD